MSVLACNRVGCENVMCDYYSHAYGYICWECLQELKDKGMCDIGTFMNEYKDNADDSEAWENYVDTLFKSRYEEYENES